MIANGWSAHDVGVAAPLAAAIDGRLLYSEREHLGDAAAAVISIVRPSEIVLVGDTEAIPDTVAEETANALRAGRIARISGADRIETASFAARYGMRSQTRQIRFEEAVDTIAPGSVDCSTVPQLDVPGARVTNGSQDPEDNAAPLSVAEVVRIAGGCILVESVALDGRSVDEVAAIVAGDRLSSQSANRPEASSRTILAAAPPKMSITSRAHLWWGPSGTSRRRSRSSGTAGTQRTQSSRQCSTPVWM